MKTEQVSQSEQTAKMDTIKKMYSTSETIEIVTKIAVKLLQEIPLNRTEGEIASVFLMDYVDFITKSSKGGKVKKYDSPEKLLEAQRKQKRAWYQRNKLKVE